MAEDLRHWVDEDLARVPGFLESCPSACDMTGKQWLALDGRQVAEKFGHPPASIIALNVVAKMQAVLRFLRHEVDDAAPFDRRFDVEQLCKWLSTSCTFEPSMMAAKFQAEAICGEDLLDIVSSPDGGRVELGQMGLQRGNIGFLQRAVLATPATAPSTSPYVVLLDIPHVWTEAVELDDSWSEYTL